MPILRPNDPMGLLGETRNVIDKKQLQKPDDTQPNITCAARCESLFGGRGKMDRRNEIAYQRCLDRCERQEGREKGKPEEGECPEGKGRAYEGCPCGEVYGTKTGKCAPGYKFQTIEGPEDLTKDGATYEEGMVGRCVCQKAIQDWEGKQGQAAGGEFKWSPEMQALLQRILDRANMLLDQPLGLSEEERQAIYNRIFEKVKGMERPMIQSEMDKISRQGLLGSPYAERGIAAIQRGTGQALAGAERDIEIEEAQRRFEQLMGTTGMVQSLFGTGMGAEQIAEALSSARRGEGQAAMDSLLRYFGMIYGGQNNTYWQAILNQLMQKGGGNSSMADWLPYLAYILPGYLR